MCVYVWSERLGVAVLTRGILKEQTVFVCVGGLRERKKKWGGDGEGTAGRRADILVCVRGAVTAGEIARISDPRRCRRGPTHTSCRGYYRPWRLPREVCRSWRPIAHVDLCCGPHHASRVAWRLLTYPELLLSLTTLLRSSFSPYFLGSFRLTPAPCFLRRRGCSLHFRDVTRALISRDKPSSVFKDHDQVSHLKVLVLSFFQIPLLLTTGYFRHLC